MAPRRPCWYVAHRKSAGRSRGTLRELHGDTRRLLVSPEHGRRVGTAAGVGQAGRQQMGQGSLAAGKESYKKMLHSLILTKGLTGHMRGCQAS